jgi:hypothetical protein
MADPTIRNGLVGAVLAVATGLAIWEFGFNNSSPAPTIEGPSTVYVTSLPGLPILSQFTLRGYSDGGYRMMYWTDTFGQQVSFAGDGVNQPFRCPDVGTFTVTLTEVNRGGHRGMTSQSIDCRSGR